MKKLTYFLVFFSFIFVSQANAQSKSKKVQTIEFEVHGVCEMCKERIESAMDYKGIKLAEWDKSTKMLKVVFNTKKVTEQELHELVAKAGHDTPKATATNEVYNELPGCCQYRDENLHTH